MNQIKVTTGNVIRTKYMQSLMSKTHSSVPIQAGKQGTIVGAWEALIAEEIHQDYLKDHSEACEIVDSVSSPGMSANQSYKKAAYLITSSKVLSHETPA